MRHKIVVLSGKGGVGKSTFSSLLGQAFAGMRMMGSNTQHRAAGTEGEEQDNGDNDNGNGNDNDNDDDDDDAGEAPTVGIMDTDICGPSIPKMLGVEDETIHVSNAGWSPVWVSDNLAVMSVQFMLPNRHDAVIWRGPKKNGLIKKFLKDVEWGALDYLIVDTPPGTSDEHLSVNTYLKGSNIDGAVLVTTPQEVALLDVRKEIDFCRKAGIPIIGLVENMAAFVCPKCTHESLIFRPTTGGGRRLAKEMNIPFLGAVPLDPRVGMACDFGESFLDNYPDSPASLAVRGVVREICGMIGEKVDNRSGAI